MIHTHLNQSAGFSQSLPSISTSREGTTLSIPTTFVLPEFAARCGGKLSSGRIPPSFENGSLYLDPWGRSYKQPLIEYYLRATLEYRVANETTIRTISAKRKIKITTAPHSDPPQYSEKESELEHITASADICRSRFSKPFARLSLAMTEPLPVVASGVSGCCQTVGQLHLTWETLSEAYDEFELGRRCVEIEYELQTRTRYRTRVLPGGQNSKAGDEARPRERLETTPLGIIEVRATDRHDVRIIASQQQWRGHTGTIPIAVQIAEGTVPSFAHVLASRDYALVVKAKIKGLQHKALSVKVPLQVCETFAVVDNDHSRVGSEMYAKMALSEVSDVPFANAVGVRRDSRDS